MKRCASGMKHRFTYKPLNTSPFLRRKHALSSTNPSCSSAKFGKIVIFSSSVTLSSSSSPQRMTFFPGAPCPIEFSNEEMELHDKELLNVEVVGKILRSFRCGSLLPVGDTVGPEDYGNAIQSSRNLKIGFLRLVREDEERELVDKIGPYQEPED